MTQPGERERLVKDLRMMVAAGRAIDICTSAADLLEADGVELAAISALQKKWRATGSQVYAHCANEVDIALATPTLADENGGGK